jgi:hypothetical protein
MTKTVDNGYLGQGLGQAQKSGDVKLAYGISTLHSDI